MAATRSARKSEAERYHAAAEEALDQLEWVVQYLYKIRKPKLASVLDQNRRFIKARL